MAKAQFETIKEALAEYTRKATASAAQARKTLVREGIYDRDGKLNANYREEQTKAS